MSFAVIAGSRRFAASTARVSVLAETVIRPAFDRGHYARIDFVSPAGAAIVSKVLPPEEGRYPAWFVNLFPLESPTAESLSPSVATTPLTSTRPSAIQASRSASRRSACR